MKDKLACGGTELPGLFLTPTAHMELEAAAPVSPGTLENCMFLSLHSEIRMFHTLNTL